MRQLNYERAHTVAWHDVPAPTLRSDLGALVRPLVVTTCDVDGVVISGLARLRGPVPLGHEGVAEVVEVGDRVSDFQPGDRVLVPWKISCGTCAKCQAGHTAHCRSVPREAAYSWGPTAQEYGGFLSDLVYVPWADHMLCPVPPGVDPVRAAGVADNITDAWRAVGPPLAESPHGTVLIAGGGGPGSIGLMAAGLAHALGAARIVYLDWDAGRRSIAEQSYGAAVIDTATGLPEELDNRDFDITVDASGNPAVLALVLRHTGDNGTCTCTTAAIYAAGDVPVPMLHMYRRGVTLRTGWVDTRPLMTHPLGLIANGTYDPQPTVTSVVGFDDAPAALVEPFTKLVVTRKPR